MPAPERTPPPPGLPCAPDAIDDFLGTPTAGATQALAGARGPFLILGAGGKIGLHLAIMVRRALDQLGRRDPVIAVSRFSTLRDQAEFTARGVEVLAGDLADPATLARLPDAPTVSVSCTAGRAARNAASSGPSTGARLAAAATATGAAAGKGAASRAARRNAAPERITAARRP